jgi:hypothetical protein
MDAPPMNAGSTSAQLKGDINSGRTGDKNEVFDPGLSPLGTDDEAAGVSPSADQVDLARHQENVAGRQQQGQLRPPELAQGALCLCGLYRPRSHALRRRFFDVLRRRDAGTDNDFRFEPNALGRWMALQEVDEDRSRSSAQLTTRLMDCGQRRLGNGGKIDVVEPGHRDIVWNSQARR